MSSNQSVATISNNGLVTALTPGNTTITYINACTQTIVINVNPNPQILGNIPICVNSSLTLTGIGTPAFSNAWISMNPNIATITNLGLVTGMMAGTTKIKYYNNFNCCDSINVVVNSTPSLPNIVLDDICSGNTFTYDPSQNLSPSSIFNTNTILNWTVNPNPNVSGQSAYNGSNYSEISQTLTNLTNIEQTLIYNVTAIDTTSILNCSSNVFTVQVNVHPKPKITQNIQAEICSGDTFDTTLVNNPPFHIIPNGTTYSWSTPSQLNPTPVLTGFTTGNNLSNFSQNINNTGIFANTLVYTLTPKYIVSSSLSCVGSNFNVTILVHPIPTVTATSASQNNVICPGTSVTLTALGIPFTSPNGGTGSYLWTYNLPSSPSIGSVITVQPTQTTTFNVVYTLPVLTSTFPGCSSQPFPITITVQNPPDITVLTASENTICVGGCTNLTANFIGNLSIDSVQWNIPGQIPQWTYSSPHVIQVCPNDTTTYSATAFGGGCNGNIELITINVNPDATTSQINSDTTICIGGTIPLTTQFIGGAGTTNYQWYQNTNPSNTGGTLITPQVNNPIYFPGNTNNFFAPYDISGNYYYYCVVSFSGNGCNDAPTLPFHVTVVNDPIVSINSADQNLCIDTAGTASCLTATVAGGVGTNTYQWIPTGAVTPTFCPPSDQVGTINYSVIVQQSGIACGSLPSNQVSITVIPDPIINITGITDVCEGAEVPLNTSVSGGIGSVADYQWYESNPTGQPYQLISGATSLNYTSPVLTTNSTYVVEVNLTGVGCNDTDTFAINVYDDPLITIQGNLMACMNEQIDLTTIFTGGTPNSSNTYTWYSAINENIPNSILLQSTSILNTYSFNIYQDTSIFVIVTNTGFDCDNDTSALINIDGIEWAEASFDMDPSDLSQSLINPTFSFINTSLNSTNYFWDLGECDPQSPMSELFTPPTPFYDPTDKDQIGYTYGCPPGLYEIMLVAMNQGMCPDTAYQVIRIQDELLVYVPNTFTPDYDENNQFFYPVITTIIKPQTYEFTIFDRWGEIVYESKEVPPAPNSQPNTNNSWNGTINGHACQDGTYIWKLRFTIKESGDVYEKIGHVNLLK